MNSLSLCCTVPLCVVHLLLCAQPALCSTSPDPQGRDAIAVAFTPSAPPVEVEFTSTRSDRGDLLLQRTKYQDGPYSLLAEMGDIRIGDGPATLPSVSGRGTRMVVGTGSALGDLRFQGFATTGVNRKGCDSTWAGASTEIASASLRLKTLYVGGRESLEPGPFSSGERRGEVVGFMAVLDPFQERLSAATEAYLASYEPDSSDDVSSVRDSALRFKIGGVYGTASYRLLYERTGPQYRLLTGEGPARDREGVSLNVSKDFSAHGVDVVVSRYNDNIEGSTTRPVLYHYAGQIDYRLRAIQSLPLALQYRRSLVQSAREPSGYAEKKRDEETVAGKVEYLAGTWQLGLEGSFFRRNDLVRGELAATGASLSLLPKVSAGAFTVAPEILLRRSSDFTNSLHGKDCVVNVGIFGNGFNSLDYELRGGLKKEWRTRGDGKDTVNAKARAAFPVGKRVTLGVRGEYSTSLNQIAGKNQDSLSILVAIEGVATPKR